MGTMTLADSDDRSSSRARTARDGSTPESEPTEGTGPVAPAVLVAVAVVAGLVALGSTASPTGAPAIDAVMIVAVVAAVTWTSAWAPWWIPTAAAGVAATVSFSWIPGVAAAIAFVVGGSLASVRRSGPVVQAVVTGVALNALIRSDFQPFFGASAVVGVTVGLVVLVAGVIGQAPSVRRPTSFVAVALAAVTVAIVAMFGASMLVARANLENGNELARRGLSQLALGDISSAQRLFERAAASFDSADSNASGPWSQPARLVPVLAQHRAALSVVSSTSASSLGEIAEQLSAVDLGELRVSQGRIDLGAIEALVGPVERLRAEVDALWSVLAEAQDPWLIEPVRDRLIDLADEVAAERDRIDQMADVIERAPEMLGADGPRVYLVAFTTPVEARGHGGFFGNFAEIHADDGLITLEEFGRNTALNRRGSRPRTVTGPDDWLGRYARFGFDSGPDGTVGESPWQNVTMSPHFPSTGAVMAELYPQSGGRAVDGVFAVDVESVAALLRFTGPIRVEEQAVTLYPGNAARYLLIEQYRIDDRADRIDLLDSVSREVIERLLDDSFPGPVALGRTFGPLVAEGRVTGYSVHESDQLLFEQLGMSGALPSPDAGDVVAVSLNNTGGGKIDYFLEVAMDYRVSAVDETSTGADLVLSLTNSAPTTGWPDYVIGNLVDLPIGTSRLWVSVHTGRTVVAVTVDGEPVGFEVVEEAGLSAIGVLVELPSGATHTLEFGFGADPIPLTDESRTYVRTPPAVLPFATTVTLTNSEGVESLHRFERPGTAVFGAPKPARR